MGSGHQRGRDGLVAVLDRQEQRRHAVVGRGVHVRVGLVEHCHARHVPVPGGLAVQVWSKSNSKYLEFEMRAQRTRSAFSDLGIIFTSSLRSVLGYTEFCIPNLILKRLPEIYKIPPTTCQDLVNSIITFIFIAFSDGGRTTV